MTARDMSEVWDAAILGAGPSGVSCALWVSLLGLAPIVIEARGHVGGRPADSPYPNPWVAALPPEATGLTIAGHLAANLAARDIPALLGVQAKIVRREGDCFHLTAGERRITARSLVLATGLRADTGGHEAADGVQFGPGRGVFGEDYRGRSVAILGGGDNAFEHAALVQGRGAVRVRLFARGIRARADLVAAVPKEAVIRGAPALDTSARTVNGERFDRILVMYGFMPDIPPLGDLQPALDRRGFVATDPATAETSVPGVYAIGDLAGRAHPSVPTALADGVVAAKGIEAKSRKTHTVS